MNQQATHPMGLERTLSQATRFLDEVRRDVERAVAAGSDTPPRLRSVHRKQGQTSPVYRTLSIDVPEDQRGDFPGFLSRAIARYAREKRPDCLLLAVEAVLPREEGEPGPVIITEARDTSGSRLFWLQPYRVEGRRVEWDEPQNGGWQDPGKEELILDAAFESPG
jgi:hypothetical protein